LSLLQTSLTNDLNRIGPAGRSTSNLLDETDASVLDDIIGWWVAKERFDVMPNASNTARVISVLGGQDVTGERGRHRRAGTTGARAPGDGRPRASRGRAFHGGRFRIQGGVVPRGVRLYR